MPAVGRLRRERHLGSHGECAVCAEQDHRSTGTAVAPPAVDHKRPVSDRAGAFIARAAYGVDAHGKLSPSSRCQPTGVPAAATVPLPWKIIQTPQVILILYEENNIFRQTFLDGRPLPRIRTRDGWAIRSDGGKATRWSSTAADSGKAVGSIVWAIRTAPICI